MIDVTEHTGRCLCGAVKLTAKIGHLSVGACHCSMCRKWGGGPLLAIDAVKEIDFDGKDEITVFQSSQWAERGFCRRCGTHLFYRVKQNNHYIIPVGVLDDQTPWTFDGQIFIDEKPAFYHFANATKQLTGAEVFAMHAPPTS